MGNVLLECLETAGGKLTDVTLFFGVFVDSVPKGNCPIPDSQVVLLDVLTGESVVAEDPLGGVEQEGQAEQEGKGQGQVLLQTASEVPNDVFPVHHVLIQHDLSGPLILPRHQHGPQQSQGKETHVQQLLPETLESEFFDFEPALLLKLGGSHRLLLLQEGGQQQVTPKCLVPEGINAGVADEIGHPYQTLCDQGLELVPEQLLSLLVAQQQSQAFPTFLPADGESQDFDHQLQAMNCDEVKVVEGDFPLLMSVCQVPIVEPPLEMSQVGEAQQGKEEQIQAGGEVEKGEQHQTVEDILLFLFLEIGFFFRVESPGKQFEHDSNIEKLQVHDETLPDCPENMFQIPALVIQRTVLVSQCLPGIHHQNHVHHCHRHSQQVLSQLTPHLNMFSHRSQLTQLVFPDQPLIPPSHQQQQARHRQHYPCNLDQEAVALQLEEVVDGVELEGEKSQ